MLEESCKLPPLYPDTFGTVAAAILKDIIGLTVHVTHNNCCNVYKSLVRVIDWLVDDGVTICSTIENITDDTDRDSD